MFKKILLTIFLVLALALPAHGAASYFVVSGVARTGGGTGALDAIECEDIRCNNSDTAITTGSIAFIVDSSKILYVYRYNATGETAESDPDIIVPDDRSDCSNQGQWELIISLQLAPSTTAKLAFKDSNCPGADKDVGNIVISYIDGGDGAENADILIRITQGGAEDTLVLQFDESDDQWEFKKDAHFEEDIEVATGKHITVGSNQWDNGSDKIDGAMIEDNGIDSAQYAAASIDNEHLANDAVAMDELDDDGNFTDWTGNWTFATGTFTLSNGATVSAEIDSSSTISANLFAPDSAGGGDLGHVDLEFQDLYLGASGVIYAEADQGTTLTSSATAWTMNLDLIVSGGDLDFGNLAVGIGTGAEDSFTFSTDGTGTAEIALPAGSIDGTEILDNTVDSDDYAAASIDNEHLADNAVDTAEINTDAVTMDSVDADGAFTSLTGAWATTGLLSGGVITKVAAAPYTIGTTNAAEAYGGVIYVTGAHEMTLPAVLAGMSFTVITIGDNAVVLDPDAGGTEDRICLDGTDGGEGKNVTNTSGTGDCIVCTYYKADYWYCMSGSNDGDPWTMEE